MKRLLGLALCLARAAHADALAKGPDALFQLTEFAGGLGPVTDFQFLPDGRTVITEKSGALKLRRLDGKIVLAGQFPVDDRSEKGLLGVAADPDFARTRRLFLYYSRGSEAGGTDLDRHRVISVRLDGDAVNPTTEKILVRGLRGPANHDGGALAIGPDGKLYVGVGDTGCNSNREPTPTAPPGNYFGTCLSNANGKILRVNLDGSIPDDNPLAKVAAVEACGERCRDAVPTGKLAPPRREIWAWGFRNPWRFWFDPKTGRLWVGDVGEITYEELDLAVAGRHHGWPWREGRHGWPVEKCRGVKPDTGACVEPIYECRHGAAADGVDGDCKSITGGVIVDACQWPDGYRGRYVFADNANGQLYTLEVNAARDGILPGSRRNLGRLSSGIPVSVHLGPDGNVYIAVFPGSDGRILRIAPRAPRPCK